MSTAVSNIQDITIIEDGVSSAGDTGLITITANPFTVRVRIATLPGSYLIGFYDTMAHAIAGIAAASTASQFGASATPQTITTWMGTTSPQTGFVATRTLLNGGAMTDQYEGGGEIAAG